jgi:hypothetical protein
LAAREEAAAVIVRILTSADITVRMEGGELREEGEPLFIVQVVGVEGGHAVRDVVVDGVSLREPLARGPEDEVTIYLEAMEVRIYGEERAEITTGRPAPSTTSRA